MLIDSLLNSYRLLIAKKRWRSNNKHNFTRLVSRFHQECISVGNYTYGPIHALIQSTECYLKIGHFCSIANGVIFLLGDEHPLNHISSYPFKVRILHEKTEAFSKGNIIIGDDVWIGTNALILSNVRIGQGAVVAAGAVVTTDIPPYSIVGGVPAKIIKYRFNEGTISKLLAIDFSNITEKHIRDNINKFYESINQYDEFSWLPNKQNNNIEGLY